MKILIIENEYASIKPVFDAAETIVLHEEIERKICQKSQDIPWTILSTYDALFIDISLAPRSELDGYGIIDNLIQKYPMVIPKTAIITGNDRIKDMLKERGIDEDQIAIFTKPLRYKDIANYIKYNNENLG